MTGMEFHPLANLFPQLEDKELDELAADIREHGLREPIVTFEDEILDGRNRYLACKRAGVEPRFEEYTGADPLAYVVSLNLKRRHLDESQRSMVAARIASLPHGSNQHRTGQLADAPTQERAADLLNVGERSVRRAREVLDEGAPELVNAVELGHASVSAAASVASLPKDEQREIVARSEDEIVKAANRIRRERKNERLGPIIAPILTEEQKQHIDGAIASLKMIRARLANNGIHHFTGGIDSLIADLGFERALG
jgi:hypothetical protein